MESRPTQANYSLRTHYSSAFILKWGKGVQAFLGSQRGRRQVIPWPRERCPLWAALVGNSGYVLFGKQLCVSVWNPLAESTQSSKWQWADEKCPENGWVPMRVLGDGSSKDSWGQSISQLFPFRVYLCFQNSCKIMATWNRINQGPLFVRWDQANRKDWSPVWVQWSRSPPRWEEGTLSSLATWWE